MDQSIKVVLLFPSTYSTEDVISCRMFAFKEKANVDMTEEILLNISRIPLTFGE